MSDKNESVLTIGDAPEFCGHLGNGCGICAPPVLAADMRVLLRSTYFTIPAMFRCGVTAGPLSDGRFIPSRRQYTGGTTGIGQTGDNQGQGTGILDVQTGLHTSFATDGYPHKSRTLRVRAIGIMPQGQALIPANFAGDFDTSVCSLGGSAAVAPNDRVVIPEPLSTQLTPALISSFFSFYRFQLGLEDETSKWLFGPQEMNIAGLGMHNGPAPSNAEPIGGKMLKLPFAIDVPPQQSRKGIIAATWEFVRDIIGGQVWTDPANVVVGANAVCNAAAWNALGTETPSMLVQLFKVFLYGDSMHVEDAELKAKIQQIMCETKCDEVTARKLCGKLTGQS